MCRRMSRLLLIGAVLVPVVNAAAAAPKASDKSKFDTTYITKEFIAALVVYPKRTFEHPIIKRVLSEAEKIGGKKLTETNFHEMLREMGMPPNKVRELVVLADDRVASFVANGMLGELFGRAESRQTDSRPAMIVRFTEPVPHKPVIRFFIERQGSKGRARRMHAGKSYETSREYSVCFVDPKTLLVAREATLKKMLTAKAVDSPLTKRLAAAGDAEALLVFPVRPFNPFLGGIPRDTVSKDVGRLLDRTMRIEMVTVAVRLSGKRPMEVSIDMANEKNAARFARQLRDPLLPLAKKLWKAARHKAAKAAPDIEQLLKFLDDAIASIRIEQSKSHVVVAIPRPKQFDRLDVVLSSSIKRYYKAVLKTERKNRLHQIAMAMHIYHDIYKRFPGNGSDASGKHKGLSWRVHLLPCLEQDKLYKQFKLDEAWDSPHNKKLISKMPEIFKSPGVTTTGKTAIHVFVGKKTPFGGGKGIRFRDITDGTSNTFMAVEAGADKAEYWTKPGGLPFDPKKDPWKSLGKLPEGGFLGLMFDGQVRWIDRSLDVRMFKRLIQHADGQAVPNF